MTWIVGTPLPFGYSVLVSDICVTFNDISGQQKYIDCLQKIYPIGRFVIGGFSGSVEIGFRMLGVLSKELSNLPKDSAWDIDIISNNWWPRLAKHIFENSENSERTLGCEIILASVHPTKNRGDAPWPWSDVHTFSAPNFSPRKAKAMKVLTIGSGSAVKVYMDALRKLCDDFDFMKAAMLGKTGQADVLADLIDKLVKKSPTKGISSLIQVGVVMKELYEIRDHEYTEYSKDGEKKIKFPNNIARSYTEFKTLSMNLNRNFRSAIC
jgi:hypothetical protein